MGVIPGLTMRAGVAIRSPGRHTRLSSQHCQCGFLSGSRLGLKSIRISPVRDRSQVAVRAGWFNWPSTTTTKQVGAVATVNVELIFEHRPIPTVNPSQEPPALPPIEAQIWLVGEDGKEVPDSKTVTLQVQDVKQQVDISDFKVPGGFKPGAILVQNNGYPKVPFRLIAVVLTSEAFEAVEVPCFSYIEAARPDSKPIRRCFFCGPSTLPSDTPRGLQNLRNDELKAIRGELGNGGKERKIPDRVYEWDVYNDLNQLKLERSILGGRQGDHPYCRRYRTGRIIDDEGYEEAFIASEEAGQYYVPKDDEFCKPKAVDFFLGIERSREQTKKVEGQNQGFSSFQQLEEIVEGTGLPRPFVYENRELLWKHDPYFADFEFGRQRIAGIHPCTIEAVDDIKRLDPVDNDTINNILLDGGTLKQKIEDGRIFTIDYREEFLAIKTREGTPGLDFLNIEGSGKFLYAPSCVLYSTDDGRLMPVAVVLATPDKQGKDSLVYTPEDTPTEWGLAKGHFLSADACVHQNYSHFTRCHASAEVYAIATRRHLSTWHPIYRLLILHFKDTLRINGNARQSLLAADQIIEKGYAIADFCMDLAAIFYGKHFRFKTEGLPKDLKNRGMAKLKKHDGKEVVELVLKEYPYAQDGMLLWDAIGTWVEKYVDHYYKNDKVVNQDIELQKWWSDIKDEGHPDIVELKIDTEKNMWPEMDNKKDLIEILTSMIWTCSGQHSAINFGQYDYSGYTPAFPPKILKEMPERGTYPGPLRDEKDFLGSLTSIETSVRVAAITQILSFHFEDEEYLGQEIDHWFQDPAIENARAEFEEDLKKVEQNIAKCNKDPSLVTRGNAISTPYTLLSPFLLPGRSTGSGIPNSISI